MEGFPHDDTAVRNLHTMSLQVLMTGSAGRIAQWVLPYLPNSWNLRLTDRTAGQSGLSTVEALDITDYPAVVEAMRGMDAVVHLAIVSERQYVTNKPLFQTDEGEEYLRFNDASIDGNVRGTYHILEAAKAAGVKRVVLGSSLTVLLGSPRYPRTHDDLPVRPSNFYAVTKLWGEQLGEYYSRRHGLTVYCLRFGQPLEQEIMVRSQSKETILPPSRALVSSLDLAWSIECAVTTSEGPPFGAYTIVSASDDPGFDPSKAEEIGWRPRTRCEPDCRCSEI